LPVRLSVCLSVRPFAGTPSWKATPTAKRKWCLNVPRARSSRCVDYCLQFKRSMVKSHRRSKPPGITQIWRSHGLCGGHLIYRRRLRRSAAGRTDAYHVGTRPRRLFLSRSSRRRVVVGVWNSVDVVLPVTTYVCSLLDACYRPIPDPCPRIMFHSSPHDDDDDYRDYRRLFVPFAPRSSFTVQRQQRAAAWTWRSPELRCGSRVQF